ncbi:hypothetical protein [Natrinema salinisoli]|uniref:hypothetical protein n=1 Tax=Natrinema salinisoli TaxID=2878535 RepID=UPI001CEFD052|nr:hypothetical protein [Natrinema salinisoli]
MIKETVVQLGEERATGFYHVDQQDIVPEMYGRIWRVNLVDGRAVSQGHKDVEAITLQTDQVTVSRRTGKEVVAIDEVGSILVKAERDGQMALARWSQ